MQGLTYRNGSYETSSPHGSIISRKLPSSVFFIRLLYRITEARIKSGKSLYDYTAWYEDCLKLLRALEDAGCIFRITGIENLTEHRGSCVIVANHMSTLETVVLSAITFPMKKISFVVKEDLIRYPLFGPVLAATDPIVVTRTQPRKDLITVLKEGTRSLGEGRSVVIFPQTSRSTELRAEQFNTIGVKLAKRADVPIIPLALKTDAWRTGGYLKDLGRIDPSHPVYFSFGKPLSVQGQGGSVHRAILEFIQKNLREWKKN